MGFNPVIGDEGRRSRPTPHPKGPRQRDPKIWIGDFITNAVGERRGVPEGSAHARVELLLPRLHARTLKGCLRGRQPCGNDLMSHSISGCLEAHPGHRMPPPTGRENIPALRRQVGAVVNPPTRRPT